MRSENFIPKFEELDEDAVADFLARGGKIQYGKTHKPRKAEKWQGSSHIGAAGGKGSKGSVTGLGANTNPKGNKPVVAVEQQDINENVPTTHEDPLVVVKKNGELWTHANLSVANNIHNTDVSAKEIHSGQPVSRGNLTFAKSMHHDAEVEKDSQRGVAEGLDDVRKRRLYDLIELYRDATDPSDYYDRDIEDSEEIIDMIRKEFGSKIADQVATGSYKMHFPRHGIQRSDPLGWKKPVDRITKAGKMYKQDSDYMKNTIRSRYELSGKSATEDVEQGVAENAGQLVPNKFYVVGSEYGRTKAVAGPFDDDGEAEIEKAEYSEGGRYDAVVAQWTGKDWNFDYMMEGFASPEQEAKIRARLRQVGAKDPDNVYKIVADEFDMTEDELRAALNDEKNVAEGDAEDAAKKIQTPAYQRKAKGGDWKTTTQDLEKAKEVNVSGPEGLAAVKKKAGIVEGVRLLGSLGSDDARSAKIFWDRDWNEFVVRFYEQGEYNQEADYHTDDKQDAVDTAKSWIAKAPMAEAEKIAAHRPGWMLRMDPKLGNKFKEIEKRKKMMHKYAGKTADEISAMAAKEIKESAVKSIVTGLVRVQDIVEDRSVHGLISTRERNLIKLIVLESLKSGIEYQDALIGLVEFLKQREEPIEEVGTIAPTAPTAPGQTANAAPAGTTTSAGQPAAKPITPQGIDALAQMLKSAGLSTSQLSQVMSKARE